MKRFLVVLTLAGCTTTVMMEDPCACVVIPTMNGSLSMAVGTRAVSFDGETDTETSPTLPISGFLFAPSLEAYSSSGISVESLGGMSFEAVWPEPADLTRPAAIASLFFDDDMLATVSWEDGQSYDLGPGGGQVTLREIVPRPEGGWRVRANYAAQICRDDGSTCEAVSGSLAFDADQLPAEVLASGIVAAAS